MLKHFEIKFILLRIIIKHQKVFGATLNPGRVHSPSPCVASDANISALSARIFIVISADGYTVGIDNDSLLRHQLIKSVTH